MPDVLTAEERAAIEAAAGRVRRVAPGTTGEQRWVWCPVLRKLVPRDDAPPPNRDRRPGPMPRPEVRTRRARVRELATRGLTAAEIAVELGCARQTVYSDCWRMGLRLKRRGGR